MTPLLLVSLQLALKKTRGGQHAKKLKKAKRRAEALERIRRGDPHPRPRRVHIEVPKPLCTFYVEGKCRKVCHFLRSYFRVVTEVVQCGSSF